MIRPAVVVSAFNRPGSLQRLLDSVTRAAFPRNVPLVISIDAGGDQGSEVLRVAERFPWKHGKKRIVPHQEHLGSNRHAFYVGSLTRDYGSVIRLEDDYYVSPQFYSFAVRALEFFKKDPRIAGVSLYHLWFNGITREPFIPYLDESDVYFVQTSWSHGQVFLERQWNAYENWYRTNPHEVTPQGRLHVEWARLGKEDWFPPFAKYLVETDRYMVFPRESYCTNFGDAGTHFTRSTGFFQVPVQTRERPLRCSALDDALAVYDAFQEIHPKVLQRVVPELSVYDLDVDLNGTKSFSHLQRPFVVTSRICRSAIRRWGRELFPAEANIIEGIPGSEIALCRTEDLSRSSRDAFMTNYRRYVYARVRWMVGLRQHFLFWVMNWLRRD